MELYGMELAKMSWEDIMEADPQKENDEERRQKSCLILSLRLANTVRAGQTLNRVRAGMDVPANGTGFLLQCCEWKRARRHFRGAKNIALYIWLLPVWVCRDWSLLCDHSTEEKKNIICSPIWGGNQYMYLFRFIQHFQTPRGG